MMMLPGVLGLLGCPTAEDPIPDSTRQDTLEPDEEMESPHPEKTVRVIVTLDGEPAVDTLVLQAGTSRTWQTDADGAVSCTLDMNVHGGDIYVAASHPDARIGSVQVKSETTGELRIDLIRYLPDNEAYIFGDPGTPDRRETTNQCAHCHVSLTDSWFSSPHRSSASNPVVQDLYAGAAHTLNTQEACTSAGGRWLWGLEPGTTKDIERCYIGSGALPALNDACGTSESCDAVATEFGQCADCHAPAINGEQGGQHLLDATGIPYDYGIHCDYCHKVSDVDLAASPGSGGRLVVHRPSEPGSLGAWDNMPLSFGPYHDVLTGVMGAVQRDHFTQSLFCAGCHEHQIEGLQASDPVDTSRWPDGTFPVQSTYSEWLQGPMADVQPCQSCHMPPDPTAGNSADLYQSFDLRPGFVAGWERPTGTVRRHSWVGPRQPESGMLEISAAVFVEKRQVDETLEVHVTVKNVGPGHALPTGEPMRSMVLLVQAMCEDLPLRAIGGDVVPSFGGYRDRKNHTDDWTQWPTARVGDEVVVISQSDNYRDYTGPSPFDESGFSPAEKGLRVESYIGRSRIIDVMDGTAMFDVPLPEGDVAYLLPSDEWPDDYSAIGRYAGRPGMAFARVLVNGMGEEMVPHFLASDVRMDNRLMPQATWTSTHVFESTCTSPTARARLMYRPYSPHEDALRAWGGQQRLMVEGAR